MPTNTANEKQRVCRRCDAPLAIGWRKFTCPTCWNTPDQRCKRCKKVKPLSNFSRDSTRPSGFFPWCMTCQGEGVRAGAFQNPQDPLNGNTCAVDDTPIRGHANRRFCSNTCKDRASSLKEKYNLTVEQFRLMVSATGGICPICQKRPTEWHVDHHHRTGVVFGIVCSMCNVRSIAYTYHDVDLARRLVSYYENSPAEQLGIRVLANVARQSALDKVWKTAAEKRTSKG